MVISEKCNLLFLAFISGDVLVHMIGMELSLVFRLFYCHLFDTVSAPAPAAWPIVVPFKLGSDKGC